MEEKGERRRTRDSQQDGVENNGRQRNANCPVHKQTNKQHDPRLDDKRAQENCKQRYLYSLSGIVWVDGRSVVVVTKEEKRNREK